MIVSAIVSTAAFVTGWFLGRYAGEYKETLVKTDPMTSSYGLHVWRTRKGYGFVVRTYNYEYVRRENLTGDLLIQQLRAYQKTYNLDENTLILIEEKIYGCE